MWLYQQHDLGIVHPLRVHGLGNPPGGGDSIANPQLLQRCPALELHEGMVTGGLDLTP